MKLATRFLLIIGGATFTAILGYGLIQISQERRSLYEEAIEDHKQLVRHSIGNLQTALYLYNRFTIESTIASFLATPSVTQVILLDENGHLLTGYKRNEANENEPHQKIVKIPNELFAKLRTEVNPKEVKLSRESDQSYRVFTEIERSADQELLGKRVMGYLVLDFSLTRTLGLFRKNVERVVFWLLLLGMSTLLLSYVLLKRYIIRPITKLVEASQSVAEGNFVPVNTGAASGDIKVLENAFNKMVKSVEDHLKQKVEEERLVAVGQLASQVAHDIRSPLTALGVFVQNSKNLPENSRSLVLAAVSRIKNIANELVSKGQPNGILESPYDQRPRTTETSVPSLLRSILAEKKMQYQGNTCIELLDRIRAKDADTFVRVCRSELERVISNLVDNAIEAIGDLGGGRVELELERDESWVRVRVSDNGKGISPEDLEKIGQRGRTFGKEGGSGLGIFYAKTMLKNWGGQLNITSKIGVGTRVEVSLPRAKPPSWFVPILAIKRGTQVVVVDDDESIHLIWKERLANSHPDAKVRSFRSGQAFREWFSSTDESQDNALFLVDYEFVGEPENGIDLMESTDIISKSILVSGRFEDPEIITKCGDLGLRVLPKPLAQSIPIHVRA